MDSLCLLLAALCGQNQPVAPGPPRKTICRAAHTIHALKRSFSPQEKQKNRFQDVPGRQKLGCLYLKSRDVLPKLLFSESCFSIEAATWLDSQAFGNFTRIWVCPLKQVTVTPYSYTSGGHLFNHGRGEEKKTHTHTQKSPFNRATLSPTNYQHQQKL